MLIRKLFVRESKITHKYYSCVHSEIPRQICSVTYSSSWNVVTMASTLRRMHNLSREPKTRGQTSRLSSQGAHMDDVENPYESKKKRITYLCISAPNACSDTYLIAKQSGRRCGSEPVCWGRDRGSLLQPGVSPCSLS
jgi:hypothetical protein